MSFWSIVCGWFGFAPPAEAPAVPPEETCAGDVEDQAWEEPRESGAETPAEAACPTMPQDAWWCPSNPVHEPPRRTVGAADQSLLKELRDLVEDPKVELPHLPHVPQRVLTLLRQPDINYPAISKVLSQDQTLSAVVLRLANAAIYGGGEVTNLEVALSRLGMRGIQNLMLKESVKAITIRKTSDGRSQSEWLWRKSVACGVVMEHLAPLFRLRSDDAFVAGLLHDIGEMVLLRLVFDFQRLTDHKVPQHVLEALWQEYHERLGGALAEHWELPEMLRPLLAQHHGDIDPQDPAASFKHLLQLTDALVGRMGYGAPFDGDVTACPAARFLGLGDDPVHFEVLTCLPDLVRAELNLPV